MMAGFRNNPPKYLGGSQVQIVKDYETLKEINLISGEVTDIRQKTTSNVLQFFTEAGTKISVRPSGTEPKIKFYCEVKGKLDSYHEYDDTDRIADEKIDVILKELGLS